MKKIPLTVLIPCILEMAVSAVFALATLWFIVAGRLPGVLELLMLLMFIGNGILSYYCIKGNTYAMYGLIGMKILLFLFIPKVILVAALWLYLLVKHNSSKEYFNSIKEEDDKAIAIDKELIIKRTAIGAGVLILLIAIIGLARNSSQNISKDSEITMERLDAISSLISKYGKENNRLPLELSDIKELVDPKATLDGWGNGILYDHEKNTGLYTLTSAGRDQVYGSEDDIDLLASIPLK